MAVIPAVELTALCQEYERNANAANEAIPHTRQQSEVADQAIEDAFDAALAAIKTAIETAVPGVYTNAQKNRKIRNWLRSKLGRS